ncbi:MAG: cytochrome bc complex cytochrome b subunit [Candidatus Bipolaricaulia bacterium]
MEERRGWWEERLGLSGLKKKMLHKAFPVHSSFFLGEIALWSFVILVLTGIFLALMYEPSSTMVKVGGKEVPAAYASVERISQVPLGLIIRRVHHWAAHIMVAAVILHLLRIFFGGVYKKPREINWVVGMLLLIFTILATFAGYLLPFDEFAVTASGIGYEIARSVPWIGPWVADLVFAGRFPAPGTIPRFYSFHVMLVPWVLALLIGAHMLILLKQKHSEPPYARGRAGAGKLIGVPLWPQQTVMMAELFFLLVGGLLFISAFFPVHPIDYYGPPRPGTPAVKPEWYFLWVYGALKLIPGWMEFKLLGAEINPEALGGVIFPGLIILFLFLLPFIDRAREPKHYMDTPLTAPKRTAAGAGFLALFLVLTVGGYQEELGIPLVLLRAALLLVPLVVGFAAYGGLALAARLLRGSRVGGLEER